MIKIFLKIHTQMIQLLLIKKKYLYSNSFLSYEKNELVNKKQKIVAVVGKIF